jgi:putative oxidoreductase
MATSKEVAIFLRARRSRRASIVLAITRDMNTRNVISLLGRSLVSALFVGSGVPKFKQVEGSLDYMKSVGMPRSRALLYGAALTETALGATLVAGPRRRESAALLALYLIPVSLIFHRFWKHEGAERQMQMIQFMKNLAIIGGLAHFAASEERSARGTGWTSSGHAGISRDTRLLRAA